MQPPALVGRLGLCALAGSVLFFSPPLAAEPSSADRAAADVLFSEAKKLASDGRFVEACPKYAESQRLDPGVGTLLYLAECYEKTARLASAWTTFRDAASLARTVNQPAREKTARERAAALEPHLPRLLIELDPGTDLMGLEIRRDGQIISQALLGTAVPLDAGSHTVSATAPGKKPWSTTTELRPDATSKVKIPPLEAQPSSAPSPSSPPSASATAAPTATMAPTATAAPTATEAPAGLSTRQTAALAAGGVGLVGLGLGGYFGLRAFSRWDATKGHCAGGKCDQQGYDAGSQAHTAGTLSTVFFIVGAVGLGAGATLWFLPSQTPSSTALRVGPGSIQLEGRW